MRPNAHASERTVALQKHGLLLIESCSFELPALCLDGLGGSLPPGGSQELARLAGSAN